MRVDNYYEMSKLCKFISNSTSISLGGDVLIKLDIVHDNSLNPKGFIFEWKIVVYFATEINSNNIHKPFTDKPFPIN